MMSKLSTTSTASKTEAEAEAAAPTSIKKEMIGKLKAAIEQGQQSKAESVQHEAELIYKLATTKTTTQGRKLKGKGLLDIDIILNPNPNVVCSLTVPSTMPSTSITSTTTTTTTLDCEPPVSPTACGHMNENYGPELMFSHTFTTLYDSPYNNKNNSNSNSKKKNNKLGIVKVGQGGTQIQQWLNNDVKKKKKDKDKKKKRKKKKNRILDDGVTAIKK